MHYKMVSKVFKVAIVLLLLSFCLSPPGYSQTRDRVDRLIQELRDEAHGVRGRAARALGEIGDPRAIEPLIATLEDEDSWVRRSATEALGKMGDPRAAEPLIAVALRDENWDARRSAAEALGKIGRPAQLNS